MRNNVVIESTKYSVDEKNRVVVCELSCNMQMGRVPVFPFIYYEMWKKRFPHVKSYEGRFKVRARARCNPNDTFDEKTGKRLAESRAKAKMFRTASKVWDECRKRCVAAAHECMRFSGACASAAGNEKQHIKELESTL